jgi:hypothetical protein
MCRSKLTYKYLNIKILKENQRYKNWWALKQDVCVAEKLDLDFLDFICRLKDKIKRIIWSK